MLYLAALLFAAITYLEVIRQDIRYRRIPNFLSVFIVILACVRLLISGNLTYTVWTIATALVIFMIAIVFFWRGWLGGGDVKLVAASVLLVGYRDSYGFLVYMALAGGVLSLGILLWGFLRPAARQEKSTVPYGVAIALSAILVLISQYRQGLG